MDDARSLSRRAGTVGGWTLLSRFAGLARDIVIAHVFGAKATADAFYVAFRIPNLMRRLLAEGAFTMAFVPIYSEYKRKSPEAARAACDTIFTALVMLLLLLVGIGIVAAPWIVRLVAYGFADDPTKFALTVSLTRLMFPYLFLVSLMALMMAVLNSWRHFAMPAAAPIFLNLAMIAGAVASTHWLFEPIYGLAISVLIGGLLQLAVQVPPLVRRHLLPRLSFAWRHPSLRQLLRIMIPSVYGGAVYQLNVIMITLLASFLPTGSVSYLWYADRVTEFPLGIFAIALATVTLPVLADYRNAGDMRNFCKTVNYGLRIALAEAIPSAVGIMVLALPIVRLLFQGGEFSAESAVQTSGALVYFACGIPFISGVRNLVPAFYALHDPKTPVVIATISLVINGIAAMLLMGPMQHRGLAAAMAISSAAQFGMLMFALRKKVGPLGGRQLLRSLLGSLAAASVMGGAVWGMQRGIALESLMQRWRIMPWLCAAMVLGVAVYAMCLAVLNREEARHLWHMVRRVRRQ